jgi:RNA polymerase sigma-70 factor
MEYPNAAHAPLDRSDLLRLLVAERGPLLGFIHSIARDRDIAEDVFQNVVIITSEKCPTVENREHFLSWARTVARYEVRTISRKQRRTVALDDAVMDALESEWNQVDRGSGPALAEALERCLGRLTPNIRNLLHLRYHRELTGEALAKSLNRKTNAVHVALSRAYRFLGECIERQLAREGGNLDRPAI